MTMSKGQRGRERDGWMEKRKIKAHGVFPSGHGISFSEISAAASTPCKGRE